MSKIVIYQKPTCTTCRKVYAALKDAGVDFDAVDYFIDPIPKAKIKSLLSMMNIPAQELLRKKEPVYKSLGLANKELSEDEAIELMAKHPELIQRPIVEKGQKAVLARPAERILGFLENSVNT